MTRPNDQRFWDVDEMLRQTKAYADSSETRTVNMSEMRFGHADDGEVSLLADGERMKMTHHAFNQVCASVGAPPQYMRSLQDQDLISRCLNYGHDQPGGKDRALLVDHSTGSPLLRAQTSERYSRLWNYEVATELAALKDHGWRVPPARPTWGHEEMRTRAATASDVIDFGVESPLTVKVGDEISPSGLYASDHDMFAFMVNPDLRVDDGSDGGLMRGFFLWNSEVGVKSIGATSFFLRNVCGNHIVWGAEEVFSMRMIHTGDVQQKLQALIGELGLRSQRAASVDEARIRELQQTKIAPTSEEVVDFIQSKRLMARKHAAKTFIVGEEHREIDGDPTTFWGFANAMTRYSQTVSGQHADWRNEIDSAAGALIALCN